MNDKIQSMHLERKACVYLRQSTMRQVVENTGSRDRQYALKDKPKDYGWTDERIEIFDRDLGLSGTGTSARKDFQALLANLIKEEIGAIFVIEVSRLNRSTRDWHQLLHICRFTNTLIIDSDGSYDPNNFNDQLILGVKGVLSQAELEIMAMRLRGAKLHKAKKGELRFRLPPGFCRDEAGRIVQNPDDEVRNCIKTFFSLYRGAASANDVVRYFHKHNLLFPCNVSRGPKAGNTKWVPLNRDIALRVLKNPSYAGAYAYGRHKSYKQLDDDGDICSKRKRLPHTQWEVCLQDHHEGYISWNEFLQNQEKLLSCNIAKCETGQMGPVREGSALLQGIILCKHCGHYMNTRYHKRKNALKGTYNCSGEIVSGINSYCTIIPAKHVDEAISKRVLEIMERDKLQFALAACDDLDREHDTLDQQWHLKLHRVQYEVDIAERRCKHVDPANKNVFDNLSREWEESLLCLKQLRDEYEAFCNEQARKLTSGERQKILSLSQDIRQLWTAPTTTSKERKQIVRHLIKDVSVVRENQRVVICIRWKGGATEEITLALANRQKAEEKKYMEAVRAQIRTMTHDKSDREIAEILNKKGFKNARGGEFNTRRIFTLRKIYKIEKQEQVMA